MEALSPALESAFYTKADVAVILRRSTKSVERLMKQGLLKRDPTLNSPALEIDVPPFEGACLRLSQPRATQELREVGALGKVHRALAAALALDLLPSRIADFSI